MYFLLKIHCLVEHDMSRIQQKITTLSAKIADNLEKITSFTLLQKFQYYSLSKEILRNSFICPIYKK